MKQLVDLLHRRKKAFLIAAALAAGGYASYSYYRSESFQRRKRQVILILDGLGKLLQAAASAADSASLISGDLKDFLESSNEEGEVPRSIRQLLKILRCPELQDLVAVTTSSVCKVIMAGTSPEDTSPSRAHHEKSLDRNNLVMYRDRLQFRAESSDGWRRERYENFEVKRTVPGSSSKPSRTMRHEGLSEKLLNKLFSDPGKGFASAIVGSAVRNLVVCYFEEMERKAELENESAPEIFELGANGIVRTHGRLSEDPGEWKPAKLLDLACSTKGKALLAECIQIVVEATVSTYLDKTQEVNMFEEMVEAVTKPVHRVPAQEMIVSVCNGAVDTFVRTSYEVLSESSKQTTRLDMTPVSFNSSEAVSALQQGPGNYLEKIFGALTIPSNRMLVMDLAGKVTAEAVRSFFGLVIAVSAPYVRSSRDVVHSKAAVVRTRFSQDAATKVLVLVTVCLAVFLHIFVNTSISLK
ncbi:protein PHLOEM PROTEIN 2-LIKE A10 [Selaginella moellendorffii]|uniref:protein PHLOEM PROTEIN 2-LIKE A10 n=1 Tax=Selaginella moellendorffii TaxID=88036 RepID=UPI000D1D03FB|nr:protein PHLOEM PROTEIN 2-LIKE A10 [Selaginella moellendorffii]|eukprot:XP_024525965.1 protein PHLOEM PROTEIN 2-LIKE A10 [Selaginella moellendorffii]